MIRTPRKGIFNKLLDETAISSEVSNFAKGLKARTYGYSATGTDTIHHRRGPQ